MKLTTTDGAVVDVGVEEVLRAAGRVYQARRKVHGGPTRVFSCRWCSGEIRGRAALDLHERNCTEKPSGDLVEFTSADMAALAFELSTLVHVVQFQPVSPRSVGC
jgi:hypothetical protein